MRFLVSAPNCRRAQLTHFSTLEQGFDTIYSRARLNCPFKCENCGMRFPTRGKLH
ncbi:uncharacterized protein LY89DRAFT_686671 [Mollisia scopiformis]|uniref:C2H2-type domain-containing protein n=1 Tax=Mollisia scopiformis TaxID=149040 RepID=A0A194X2B8_MOLSC|nr:uncharacterized protein LY89DRAFT_686671 [Mollisia scopiformis]KUJ14144.1 hypothetical protein LY89DRAFT_686671 [Mollisia scopiformis]